MDKTIALVQSKTFWAALLALLAQVATVFGWQHLLTFANDPASQTAILNIVSIAATTMAIVFRFVASAQVTSILPKSAAGAGPTASAIAILAAIGALALTLSACQETQVAAASCAGAEAGADIAVTVTSGGARTSAEKTQAVVDDACPAIVAGVAAAAGK